MRNLSRAGALLAAGLLSAVAPAGAATYLLPPPDVDLIGTVGSVTTRYEETLLDVARRHGLGYEEIISANPGVDPWLPGEGTEIVLPTRYILPAVPREGIVVNLPEFRLYYFPKRLPGKPAEVVTHPISTGRMDWRTPLGLTRIVDKVKDPTWYPPQSVRDEHAADGDILPRIVPPGPENPLGRHAMRLAIPGYLIHGTNKPSGIGMQVTHGCIRMYPEDVEALYASVPIDTPVRIINVPVKAGWLADALFLEVHRPHEHGPDGGPALTDVTRSLVRATEQRVAPVDWDDAHRIFDEARGLPVEMRLRDADAISTVRDAAP